MTSLYMSLLYMRFPVYMFFFPDLMYLIPLYYESCECVFWSLTAKHFFACFIKMFSLSCDWFNSIINFLSCKGPEETLQILRPAVTNLHHVSNWEHWKLPHLTFFMMDSQTVAVLRHPLRDSNGNQTTTEK